MFDAPRIFGTTVASIPAACGYIQAEPARAERWRAVLSRLAGLKVGLVWQGRPSHEHDWLRSIPLQMLAPLLEVEGVSFVSLQKGAGSEQIAGSAFAGRLLDRTSEWDADGDGIFLDTAAIVAGLDLTISIDSAVTHLAGAMGRPVWTLLQSLAGLAVDARARRQPVVSDDEAVQTNGVPRLDRANHPRGRGA